MYNNYYLSSNSYEQMHWWKAENGYYVQYLYHTGFGETLDKAKRAIKKNMKEEYEKMIKLPVVSKRTLEKEFTF